MSKADFFVGTASINFSSQFQVLGQPWKPTVHYGMPFGLTPPMGFMGISIGSANTSMATLSAAGITYHAEAHVIRFELNPKLNEPPLNIDTYQQFTSDNYIKIYKTPFTSFHWPKPNSPLINLLPNETKYIVESILRKESRL